MNKEIPTAEEYLKKLDEESGTTWTENNEEICKAFIEFAKLHCKRQAEVIAKNVLMRKSSYKGSWTVEGKIDINEYTDIEVDKDSILNAYPLTNIK